MDLRSPFRTTPAGDGVCIVPSSGVGLASLAIKIEAHAVRKRLLAPLWFVKGVFAQYCAKRSPMKDHLRDFCGQSLLVPMEIPASYLYPVFFVWAEIMGVLSSQYHKGPIGIHVPLVRCLKGTALDISKTIDFLLHFFNSSYACIHIKHSNTKKRGEGISLRRNGVKCFTMARMLSLESTGGQPHLEVFFPQAESVFNEEEGHFVSLNPDLIMALRGPQGLKKLMHYFLFEMNKRFSLQAQEPFFSKPNPCVTQSVSFAHLSRSHNDNLNTAVPLYDHGVLTWRVTAPPGPISQIRGDRPRGVVVCWFPSEHTQAAAELEATLEAHLRLAGAWTPPQSGGEVLLTPPLPLLPPPPTPQLPLVNGSENKNLEPTSAPRLGATSHQAVVPPPPLPRIYRKPSRFSHGGTVPITPRAGAISKPPFTPAMGRLFEEPPSQETAMSEAEFLTQVLELYESLTPLQRRHFEMDRASMDEVQFKNYVMPILLKRRRFASIQSAARRRSQT